MGTVFSTPIEVERPPLNPNSWLRHLPMVFALDVLGVRLLILTPSAKGKPPRAGSVNQRYATRQDPSPRRPVWGAPKP